MKAFMTIAAIAATLAAAPAFAGRDPGQEYQQNRAIAAKRAQAQQVQGATGAAGPAGQAGREGAAGTQLELMKQVHPKQAYGPPSGR